MELQPGDIIFEMSRYHGLRKHAVIRVTSTQAIINDGVVATKLRRAFVEGDRAIGASGFGCSNYYRHTEKLQSEYDRQIKLQFIKEQSTKQQMLSDAEIDELYSFWKRIADKQP